MQSETRAFLVILLGTFVLIIGAAFFFTSNGGETPKSNDLLSEGSYATGSATPKVTVVEFSDFECPACILAEPQVNAMLDKYFDKVRFVYRHFPLPQHSLAQKAAEAAEAAGAQGKFWEYRKLLFGADGKLAISDLERMASSSGLDMGRFKSELSSGKYADRVALDVAAGNKFGVTATPTFFVNGKKVVGGNDLLPSVRSELEK